MNDILQLVVREVAASAADPPRAYLTCALVSRDWNAATAAAFGGAAEWELDRPVNILVRALLRQGYARPWTLRQRVLFAPLLCLKSANMATLRLLSKIYDYTITTKYILMSPLPLQEVLEHYKYAPVVVGAMLYQPVAAPAESIAALFARDTGYTVTRIRTLEPFTDDMMADYPEGARGMLMICNNSYEIKPGTSAVEYFNRMGASVYRRYISILYHFGRDVSAMLAMRPVAVATMITGSKTCRMLPPDLYKDFAEHAAAAHGVSTYGETCASQQCDVAIDDVRALVRDMDGLSRDELFDRVMMLRVTPPRV